MSCGRASLDTSMFSVFDYPFVNGSLETSFPNPNAIVMTESAAKRVFGDEDPIGQTLTMESRHHPGEYTVTGIIRDLPLNRTWEFDYVATHAVSEGADQAWNQWAPTYSWRPVRTFVLLREDADLAALRAKVSNIIDRYMGAEIRKNNDYHLQLIQDIYLYSNRDYNIDWHGDINRVYQFGAIALIVLAIACINFANLSTARSARRAAEVGLRKVTGARRSQLISQFLGESIVTSLLALALALLLVVLVIGEFNAFFNKQLSIDLTDDPSLAVALAGIALGVGIVAGLYPAFFLSSFQPTETLKGTSQAGTRGHWIRKGLVIAQFAISIVLIVGTGVVYQQLQYLRNKDLGYSMEQVVFLPIFGVDQWTTLKGTAKLADRYQTVKQAFTEHPTVLDATAYRWWLGWGGGMMRSVDPEGHKGTDWRMPVLEVDEDFLDFYGIQMVSGREFDPINFPADTSRAFILNHAAVEALGWETGVGSPNSAIGKAFQWVDDERNRVGHVIGVASDFHYAPLREKVAPMAMIYRPKQFINLALRLRIDDLDETLAFLEQTWKRFAPEGVEFRRFFWEEEFEALYREEHRVQHTTLIASGVAILLACMGLFALASYATEERTKEIGVRKTLGALGLFGLASYAMQERRKEIGVRKTLGASVPGLITLVSREFVTLVLIAALVAAPFTWRIMRGWLDNFAYRADLGPAAFILGAALALVIAQLTITFHAFRAAQADPVLALRDE